MGSGQRGEKRKSGVGRECRRLMGLGESGKRWGGGGEGDGKKWGREWRFTHCNQLKSTKFKDGHRMHFPNTKLGKKPQHIWEITHSGTSARHSQQCM